MRQCRGKWSSSVVGGLFEAGRARFAGAVVVTVRGEPRLRERLGRPAPVTCPAASSTHWEAFSCAAASPTHLGASNCEARAPAKSAGLAKSGVVVTEDFRPVL